MRKRRFLVGMIFLLMLLFFGGCGVSQDQYDAIVAELGEKQRNNVKKAISQLSSPKI